MRALVDDAGGADDDDAVGVPDGDEAVSDDQRGAAFESTIASGPSVPRESPA